MSAQLNETLSWLAESGHANLLGGILHGIEKEGLRVDADGKLAQTGHPRALGSTLTHANITTDYSEALMEFITPVFDQAEDALDFLANLHRFTFENLDDEELWCASMPCAINHDDEIRIGEYGSSNIGQMKHIYRVGLEHRYGKMMQTIAGIHYNVSMPEKLWPHYQQWLGNKDSLQDFQSASYFKLIRNFRRFSWLLLYLFGASPALPAAFMKGKEHQLEQIGDHTLYLPYATSLRMSDLGYSNKAQASLSICFNHLNTYASTLHQAIQTPYADYQSIGIKVDGKYRQLNSNVLQIENEYYSDIRPKRVTESGEKPVHALMARGVEYIEVRNTDINPFMPLGIDSQQADFIDLFLLTCLFSSDGEISAEECDLIIANQDTVVTRGREPGLMLNTLTGEQSLQSLADSLLKDIEQTAQLMDSSQNTSRYSDSVAAQRAKLVNPELTPSAQVLAAMQKDQISHDELVLRESRRHRGTLLQQPLSECTRTTMESEAEASLEAQQQIEAGDEVSFDEFLADYMSQ